MSDSKIENAGVDAIDAKCKVIYGEQKGSHFGVKVPYYLGGPDPLDQVSVYQSKSGGIPHWHYITYGLTELYQKESDYAEESGYGFELSFRLETRVSRHLPHGLLAFFRILRAMSSRAAMFSRQTSIWMPTAPSVSGQIQNLLH